MEFPATIQKEYTITIPAQFRKFYELKPGDEVLVSIIQVKHKTEAKETVENAFIKKGGNGTQ